MPGECVVWAAHIIPGHDPLVIARYRARSAAMPDAVAKLDLDPARA
jgi:hypothetical protein